MAATSRARAAAVSAAAMLAVAATLATSVIIAGPHRRSGGVAVSLAEEHEWRPYEVLCLGEAICMSARAYYCLAPVLAIARLGNAPRMTLA